MDNRLYIINESLLDDVEVDEVRDDESAGTDYGRNFSFEMSFVIMSGTDAQMKKSLQSRFGNYMNSLVESNKIVSYSFDYEAGSKRKREKRKFTINAQFESSEHDAFDSIVAYSAAILIGYEKCNYIEGRMFLEVFPEKETGRLMFSIDCTHGFYIQIDRRISIVGFDVYKDIFGGNDNLESASGLVKKLIHYGVLLPMDEGNSRYFIYLIGNAKFCVFDRDGVGVYEKDISNIAFNTLEQKYNKYGLMRFAFGKIGGPYNIINIDGENLFKDNMPVINLWNRGFEIKKAGSDNMILLDEQGNVYTKHEISKIKTSYPDGTLLVELNVSDENDSNLIDNYGNFLFKKNFYSIGDDLNYATVCQSIAGKKSYNYIDRAGNYIWKGIKNKDYKGNEIWSDTKWFNSCANFKNGFVKVFYDNNKNNFMDSDGNLVSKTWHTEVRGYPDAGTYAYYDNIDKEWHIVDIPTGKDLFGYGFKSCEMPAEYEYEYNMKIYRVKIVTSDGKSLYNSVNADGNFVSKEWSDVHRICCISDDIFFITKKIHNVVNTKLVKMDGTVIMDYGPWEFDRYEDGVIVVRKIVNNLDYYYNIVKEDGTIFSEEWFYKLNIMRNGFISVTYNKGGFGNIYTIAGKKLLDMPINIQKCEVLVPNKLVLVMDKNFKANVIDNEGKLLFGEWFSEQVEKYSDELLKIGNLGLIDYDGNYASCI